MTIPPEVADRLIERANEIAEGHSLPNTVRGVIERALFWAAGLSLQKEEREESDWTTHF